LTAFAFPEGSVFLREDLKQSESEQLERLSRRLRADLAALSMQSARSAMAVNQAASPETTLSVGQALLQQLDEAEPMGRLVIDLVVALNDPDASPILLEDGDHLLIPSTRQEVTVIGEVQYPTSHFHGASLTRDEYLKLSGGLTANADRERIYIVRANGAVMAAGRRDNKWFRRSESTEVRPGDTIVVPLDVDRIPRLALWQSATSILFNLAIATAAVASF
jgi:hypothetical protein